MAFSARVSRDVMAQINVTPLVDVLLVLLIIFMISSPVIMHKAKMDLPQNSKTLVEPSIPIHLAIHADGAMYWNDAPIGQDQLKTQLSIAAMQTVQPALQIDAADGVAYDAVARVLSQAKAQGLEKIDMFGVR